MQQTEKEALTQCKLKEGSDSGRMSDNINT